MKRRPLSLRSFARMAGTDHRTVRYAIDRGWIPMDALELRTSANGRRSYAISDPEMAAACWQKSRPSRDSGTADGVNLPPWARTLRMLHALRDLTTIRRNIAAADDHASRAYVREEGLVRPRDVLITLAAEANKMVNETPGRERRRVRRIIDEFSRRVEAEVTKLPPARPRERKRGPARRKSGPDT